MNSTQRSKDALRSCGVELRDSALPVLHTPCALFRHQLGEAIRSDETLALAIGDYIDELLSEHDQISLYLDSAALSEGATANAGQVGAGVQQSESLVRLLLGVDALQSRLVSTLLERFPEYIGDNDDEHGGCDTGVVKVSMKILRQLRWLDYVIDSGSLMEKLLETLGFVPPDMQREIISALPDIISDVDNAEVSKVLVGMLSDAPELTLTILDTLGSLDCPLGLLQEARSSVVTQLVSAEPIDLPIMLRFLLQSVNADGAMPAIHRIRRRLDLDSVVLASRQESSKSDEDQTPDVLIFDAIAATLRSHKHLRDAWLKIIASDVDEVGPHTTLDIVVLLILHQITTHTKRVETILKSKIDAVSARSVAYTPAVFESVISRFPAAFAAHFPALLSVTSWLIRSSPLGSQGSRVASSTAMAAFASMGMFQRQEISGELAVHIGSGNANEVDTAVDIYLHLAKKHPHELRPFAMFIKGLLDYIDNLAIGHVRTIFDALGILSTLSSGGGQDDSMFNDLYIFVRKQLSSVYPKYNRIGVVGTVSLLRQLGSKDNAQYMDHDAGSSTQGLAANIPALRRAVQLLEMLLDTGRHQSWAFISMAYDELAHIIETKGIHSQLLTWLHENVSSTFATRFLSEIQELPRRYELSGPPPVALSLDDEETTVLDVYNHNGDAAAFGLHTVAKRDCSEDDMAVDEADGAEDVPKLRGCMLSCLPSLLRLIQVCEKALSSGSLSDIDALLVCGIYLLCPVDISSSGGSYSSPEPPASRFVLADSDDTSGNAALLVAGSALVGIDEDTRAELMLAISTWPVELRRTLCTSLYVTVNWIRETINAFADQPLADIRAKVVQRVNQLSQIERGLDTLAVSLVGTTSEFRPAAAGLIPELSDTAIARPVNSGSGPQIGPISALPAELHGDDEDIEQAPAHMVDASDLLLSQDDTRRLVGEETGELPPIGELPKSRGRKRKSAGGDPGPATDDFAKSPRPFLRELSFSAFRILSIADNDQSDEQCPLLSARGLSIILRELHAAVSTKLARRAERRFPWQKNTGNSNAFGTLATFSSNISGSTASDVFDSLLPILPSLLHYLDSCLAARARFRNDVELDDLGSTQRSSHIASVETLGDVGVVEECIDTLLQILSSVLYWDGLQQMDRSGLQGNRSALTSVLGALAKQGQRTDASELEEMATGVLVRRAFDYLLGLTAAVATSTRVIDVLRMLVAVRGFAPQHEDPRAMQGMVHDVREQTMDGQISSLAARILAAKWSEPENIKHSDLEYLVSQHITRCPHDRLELAHTYATRTLPTYIQNTNPLEQSVDDEEEDELLPLTLRKPTFASFYKSISQTLASLVKDAALGEMSAQELLLFVDRVVASWLALTRITQKVDVAMQRSVLLLSLRSGYAMVDLFTKNILPLLDRYFLAHQDQIVSILSRMQKSTRILQNICNHSKASKDTKLQSAVPQVKRKLEQLIFHVYALMENNDCIEAINTGNLKHRDVRGAVVGSQIPQEHYESEEDEDLGIDVDMPSDDPDGDGESSRQPVSRARRGRGAARFASAGKRKDLAERKQLLAQRRMRRSAGERD
ncbi:hypothetical protein GGF46_003364 [Coemansia sp. RSA 552]|nr:hypothetical protein GGF46_003364 [Coemansia sp. RSA 552]